MSHSNYPPVKAAGELPGRLTFDAMPVEIVAAAADGADGPKVPTFKMVAYTGGAMRLRGWLYPVVVDLAGCKAESAQIPQLRDHDPGRVVGHSESVDISEAAIRVAGLLSGGGPDAAEVAAAARNGFPWRASIGADPLKADFIAENQSGQANGRTFKGPLYIIRQSVLAECSFLSRGADSRTSIKVAAQAATKGDRLMNFEQWLKARGLDPAAVAEAEKATLKAQYDAEQAAAPPAPPATPPAAAPGAPGPVQAAAAPADPVAAMRARAAAEEDRIAAVQAAAPNHPAIRAQAIREGWDASRTELAVLKIERPRAPAGHVPSAEPLHQVMGAAICAAAKLPGLETAFPDRILQAAHKRFRRGIGLQEMFLEAAWANGHDGRHMRGDEEAVIRAAFSTSDLSGMLVDTTNKVLLAGYQSAEDVCLRIAGRRPVSDFKALTCYHLTGEGRFLKVAPDGELKHGTLGKESYTIKADTFGRLLGITRTDIINDDMGVIATAPRKLGRDAKLGLNHEFWTAFLDNSAFFTAGRLNYYANAAAALSLASLSVMVQMFRDMKDADGNPVGLTPKILLGAPANETTAKTIYTSTELRDTTASTKAGIANIHVGQYRPEISSYLSNANYPGYSALAWYLLADPQDVSVVDLAFLNGQESPIIEQAAPDPSYLGVIIRGYFDFGVALADFRAGVKSKGAA